MKFAAELLLSGKTATGIRVPPRVVAELGSSKKPAVRVAINDYSYRTTVATMSGEFMIPVSGEVRRAAGIEAGDNLDVNIELDTEPREVTVPPDFAAALKRDRAAGRLFSSLSYSNKRRFVLTIEEAKTPETRQRRIARAVETLKAGRS